MEKLMVWTKILNKGVLNVIQAIIIIILIIFIVAISRATGSAGDRANEDIRSLRDTVVSLEEQNNLASETIAGLINNNERITTRLDELKLENQRARELTGELAGDNIEHTARIRAVQDTTLEGELVIDGVEQLIREIERENDYP